MIDYSIYVISLDTTVKNALERLNSLSGGAMTLFVVKENKLQGTLTDGDIRRALLKGKSIDSTVDKFMFRTPFVLEHKNFSLIDIQKIKEKKLVLVPVVNQHNEIVQVIDFSKKKSVLPVRAIIMAGGKGTRLKPLTNATPKPMLPVGNKPIIEHNIDRLNSYGINHISITINYLGNKIEEYFGEGKQKGIEIEYIDEKGKYLGTIGSLSLIKKFDFPDVLIMNSDLFTNVDFEDMYKYFKDKNADMLIAAVPYSVKVPYAVLKTEGNEVVSFEEKPTYTYYSNAGIYFIKSDHLKNIPQNEFYNATDLIEKLIDENKKVIYYPMVNYWLDIGKHEDYEKAQEDVKHIQF